MPTENQEHTETETISTFPTVSQMVKGAISSLHPAVIDQSPELKQVVAAKPRGRPRVHPVSHNKEINKLRQQNIKNLTEQEYKSRVYLLRRLPKILQAVADKACEGDMNAAKLILDRLLPTRKAVEHLKHESNLGIQILIQGTEPPKAIEGEIINERDASSEAEWSGS